MIAAECSTLVKLLKYFFTKDIIYIPNLFGKINGHCSEIDGLSSSFCPRDVTYAIKSHFAYR